MSIILPCVESKNEMSCWCIIQFSNLYHAKPQLNRPIGLYMSLIIRFNSNNFSPYPTSFCHELVNAYSFNGTARQSRSKKNWNNANDRWRVICPRERMVGWQGLAHLRTDTHRNGRKVNVSSVYAIGCASVHPQCCREFTCVMENDDRDVNYDDVVGVSNITYGLGV